MPAIPEAGETTSLYVTVTTDNDEIALSTSTRDKIGRTS
jgi:hypothetical protein